jgi:endonuclease III
MASSSSSAPSPGALVAELLARHGQTYAQEAGIRLADKPSPLYELLVLATLLSARISADIAVGAARELFATGYRTPQAMQEASWQDRVDALGRGHYKRYDERTATMLGDGAGLVLERWHGDLRRLRDEAGGAPDAIGSLLQEFPGIGPAGAAIFLREVQGVWPSVAPYVDDRVRRGARELGLPDTAGELARLAGSEPDLARLAAALIRVTLTKNAAEPVRQAARARG